MDFAPRKIKRFMKPKENHEIPVVRNLLLKIQGEGKKSDSKASDVIGLYLLSPLDEKKRTPIKSSTHIFFEIFWLKQKPVRCPNWIHLTMMISMIYDNDIHDTRQIFMVLLMEEIPNNHLGCMKQNLNHGNNYPTSTGERRISKPSTVSPKIHTCQKWFTYNDNDKMIYTYVYIYKYIYIYHFISPKLHKNHLSPMIWNHHTLWKINGWNLQPSPMKWKEHDLKQTSMIYVPCYPLEVQQFAPENVSGTQRRKGKRLPFPSFFSGFLCC